MVLTYRIETENGSEMSFLKTLQHQPEQVPAECRAETRVLAQDGRHAEK